MPNGGRGPPVGPFGSAHAVSSSSENASSSDNRFSSSSSENGGAGGSSGDGGSSNDLGDNSSETGSDRSGSNPSSDITGSSGDSSDDARGRVGEPGVNGGEDENDEYDSDNGEESDNSNELFQSEMWRNMSSRERKQLVRHLRRSVDSLCDQNRDLIRVNLAMREELSTLVDQVGISAVLPDTLMSGRVLRRFLNGTGVEGMPGLGETGGEEAGGAPGAAVASRGREEVSSESAEEDSSVPRKRQRT